jgi:hypothetical protein
MKTIAITILLGISLLQSLGAEETVTAIWLGGNTSGKLIDPDQCKIFAKKEIVDAFVGYKNIWKGIAINEAAFKTVVHSMTTNGRKKNTSSKSLKNKPTKDK